MSFLKYLKDELDGKLHPFLGKDCTLVPIPRSSKLVEGGLWPSKAIADFLFINGFGKEVSTLLFREKTIQKSAVNSSSEHRTTVQTHYDTIKVQPGLIIPTKITLIDDFITQGRTSYACAQRLHDVYPDAEIRVFAILRTMTFYTNLENFIDISTGTVTYFPSGKTFRS